GGSGMGTSFTSAGSRGFSVADTESAVPVAKAAVRRAAVTRAGDDLASIVAGSYGLDGAAGRPSPRPALGGPASRDPIDGQHDDRAEDGHDEPDRISIPVPAQHPAHEAPDERAGDAKRDREDEASGDAPRHDELGDDSDHQTEQDPYEDVHELPPCLYCSHHDPGWSIGPKPLVAGGPRSNRTAGRARSDS